MRTDAATERSSPREVVREAALLPQELSQPASATTSMIDISRAASPDTMRQFPSAHVNSNVLSFDMTQTDAMQKSRLREQQANPSDSLQKQPERTTDGAHKNLSIEKVVGADGRPEYRVHPGADARANAALAQVAVDRATKEKGGLVNLGAGIYSGPIHVAGDNITIKGERDKTVFEMAGISSMQSDSVFQIQGKNAKLDGLTIQNWRPNAQHGPVVGIDVLGGSEHVTLQNLHIHHMGTERTVHGDPKSGSHAIRVTSNDGKSVNDVTVKDSHFHDLKLGQHEAVSFMAGTANITDVKVMNNRFNNIDNIGIVLEGSSRGQVRDFVVSGNSMADSKSGQNPTYLQASAGAIQVDTNVVGGKIVGNLIQRADFGIVLESEKGGAVRNIQITDNTFSKNTGAHIMLDASHQAGLAVDDVLIERNRYSTGTPLVKRDRDSGVGKVVLHANQVIGDDAAPNPPGSKDNHQTQQFNAKDQDRARLPGAAESYTSPIDKAPSARESSSAHVHTPGAHTRPLSDWNHFYRSQTRGNNCLPTSMSMMYADWVKGSPANDRELQSIEKLTHVGSTEGYRGSAQDIARQAQTLMPGLHTADYQSLDRKNLAATLDRHLSEGHTAIVGIKSPYSSNNHYIYIAGKDHSGNYIVGDSGRRGGGALGKTIHPDDLLNRMMARNGGSRMVAGWLDKSQGGEQQDKPAHSPNRDDREKPAYSPNGDNRDKPAGNLNRDANDKSAGSTDKTTQPGERLERRIDGVIVNASKDLDPTKPIHFVTYFHGFRSTNNNAYHEGQLSEHARKASPQDVIISPEWQDSPASESMSHQNFDKAGGLRGTLHKVFNALPELRRNQLEPKDTIGLVGFSAGYNPLGQIVSDRSFGRKITDIVMLDSPSSSVQKYVLDNLPAFARGEKRFASVAGDWRAQDYQQFSHTVENRLAQSGLNPQSYMSTGSADGYNQSTHKPFLFLYTHTPHGLLPGKHYGRVGF